MNEDLPPLLTVAQLAEAFGLNTFEMNRILWLSGWQIATSEGWALTTDGMSLGAVMTVSGKYKRDGTLVQEIMWPSSLVTQTLKQLA